MSITQPVCVFVAVIFLPGRWSKHVGITYIYCSYWSTLEIILYTNVCTVMRRLTTGIRSKKCVVRRFRRCEKVYLHKPK